MPVRRLLIASLCAPLLSLATNACGAPRLADALDPLEARVESADARRFAAVFRGANGHPAADALQRGYLDGAGDGVRVFTPDRIIDAANLAKAVASDPAKYAHAIDVCLPAAEQAIADVRAVYLAYRGLFPDAALPTVHVVFGAGNSAGTAARHAQVIGLEQACLGIGTAQAFRDTLRGLVAHEATHALQPELADDDIARHDLLVWALREGSADFFAAMVTGGDPTGSGNTWAMKREGALFREFARDRATAKAHWPAGQDPDATGAEAATRWMWNAASPEGRPADLAYWIGQRIVSAYYDRQPDKRAAIQVILAMRDPDAILRASGKENRGQSRLRAPADLKLPASSKSRL